MKNSVWFTGAFLILISFQDIYSQTGWYSVNPVPSYDDYSDMEIFSNGTGYVAGFSGSVIKTTNNGTNWFFNPDENTFQNNLPITFAFHYQTAISFLNSETGYILNNRKVFKTYDGGVTWRYRGETIDFCNATAYYLQFTDSLTGYAYGCLGELCKTTNGGFNWSSVNTPSQLGLVENKCYFINSNTGIYTDRKNRIVRTTNGGSTWTKIIDSTNTIELRKIFFINENTGFVGGMSGKLFKTVDAGVNWEIISTNITDRFDQFHFINSTTGYFFYTSAKKTTNGGYTWNNLNSSPPTFNNNGIFFNNSGMGFVFGYGGLIFRTTNDGFSWHNLTSVCNEWEVVNDMNFINASTGYFVGSNGMFLKTIDGCATFQRTSISNKNLNSIFSFNTSNFVVAGDSVILKTTNGGVNWSSTNVSAKLKKVYFITDMIGFGLKSYPVFPSGEGAIDVRTSDGGLTWTSTGLSSYGKMKFFDANNGLCVTTFSSINPNVQYSLIYRTNNAGASWNKSDSIPGIAFMTIFFLNSSTGFTNTTTSSPTGSNVYKTTNSGHNWQLISNQGSANLFFINEMTGYANSVKTTNGGVNWFKQNSIGSKFYFADVNNGFSINEGSSEIRKTTDGGGMSVGVIQISSHVPEKYLLHQNYPNPFNPSTRINYELRNTNYVSLKVFDLLGKEVAQLVNEKQNAGSYAVDFNSSEFNLPSGIYFYTLNAGEFKETKKMVLIK